ncbi:MAG: alpha/beta hydrolase [Cetobacterium sp.]|uniref:alpha/beta hydrolase n=1 Tax=Cetobacterium sp. TaxID=2071632 RepID=UPI003F37EAC0
MKKLLLGVILSINIFAEINEMSQEERVKNVERLRNRVVATISKDEFHKYNAIEKEMELQTSYGASKIFIIEPQNRETLGKLPLIINIHGGGFVKAREDRDKLFCYKIVDSIPSVIIDIDYKLAPENMFPIPIKESLEIVQWAFKNSKELNVDLNKVILMGQSAGGNIATGIINLSIEKGLELPVALVLAYPPMDLHTDPVEKILKPEDMPYAKNARLYNSFYVNEEDSKNYLASPIFTSEENLKKFPKTLLITAELDSLAKEGELFASKLSKLGVEVTSKRFLNSPHGFTINQNGEFKESVDLIIKYIKSSF